jgi:D-alanyl-D-alanine dipeptidase
MLIPITTKTHDIFLDIAYATHNNFTHNPVYEKAACFLHKDAEKKLQHAISLAKQLGLKFKIFDGFRPQAAQQKLWDHTPNPVFITDPQKGSHHTRGVAVDLTLVDSNTKKDIEMGTHFDDFTSDAFHTCQTISVEAQRNRKILLGIMSTAGWDFYEKEWWHYQLFKPREYALITFGPESDFMMSPS